VDVGQILAPELVKDKGLGESLLVFLITRRAIP
jgi:hypothetical protein